MPKGLKCHPHVLLFPRMREDEFEQLKQDIAKNGLELPIKVLKRKNLIIDGRHRYEACRELGIEPKVEVVTATSDDEVLRLVFSLNARRRQLSESQRAAIAAELANMRRGGNESNQHKKAKVQICILADEQSLSEAAENLNVSRRTVAAAKAVESNSPKVYNHTNRSNINTFVRLKYE